MADPQVAAIISSLERLAERTVVKISLDVTANLIESTPVDTGWARANWVPSIGRPAASAAVKAPESVDVPSAKQAQAGGVAAVLGYKISLGKVIISNNVPYIERLNDGHSQQAPAGFVQRSINKAVTVDILGLGG